VKLVAGHDPADTDLWGNVGEAGDEHHRDAFFLYLFADRSAATRAGSSGRGQNDGADGGIHQLGRDARADLCHLARHRAGAGGDEIVVVQFFESLWFLQNTHGVEGHDPIRILVDGRGVVAGVHRFELAAR